MATLKEIRKAIRHKMSTLQEWDSAAHAAWLADKARSEALLRHIDAGDAVAQLLGSSKVTFRGKLYSVRDGKLCIENIRQIKD